MMKKGLAILLIVTMLMTFSAGTAMAGEPEGTVAEGSLAVWEDEGVLTPQTTWNLPVIAGPSWVDLYLGTKDGDTFHSVSNISSYTMSMKKDSWPEKEEVTWDAQTQSGEDEYPFISKAGIFCEMLSVNGNQSSFILFSVDEKTLTEGEQNVNGDYTVNVEWTKDGRSYRAAVVISVKVETSLTRFYLDDEASSTDEPIKAIGSDKFALPYKPYLNYSDQEAGSYLMVDEELGLMDFVGCNADDGVFTAGEAVTYPLYETAESGTLTTPVIIDYKRVNIGDQKTYQLTFRSKKDPTREKTYTVFFEKSVPDSWETGKLYAVQEYAISKKNDGKVYIDPLYEEYGGELIDRIVLEPDRGRYYYFVSVGEDGTLTTEKMAEISDATVRVEPSSDVIENPSENSYFIYGINPWKNGKLYNVSGSKSIPYDVLLPALGVYSKTTDLQNNYMSEIYCSKLDKDDSYYYAYIMGNTNYLGTETDLTIKLFEYVEEEGNDALTEKEVEGVLFTKEENRIENGTTYRVWKMGIPKNFASDETGRECVVSVGEMINDQLMERSEVNVLIYGETTTAPAEVKSLEITTPPTKTAYVEGQYFDPTGMKVTAIYDDNTSRVLDDEEYSIIGGKKLEAGTTSVAIKVGKVTVWQEISVAPKKITSIAITEPTKKEYTVGEKANWNGLTVAAKFNDGTERALNEGEYSITGFDSSAEVDQQTITVTAGNQTATFNIKIKKAASPSYPSIGGGFIPAAQPVKVTTQSGENGKIALNPASPTVDSKVVITITPDEGYVVEDVLVDGKSVGAVTTYTVDKASANLSVSATFKKAADPSEELIEKIKDTQLVARTKMAKAKGKKAVKVYWYVKDDTDLTFDGYDVFRSVKRYSGFGKKPYFSTENEAYYNTKDLKGGTKYYYKVRAYKVVDGEKVYTDWSTKAWRTVK